MQNRKGRIEQSKQDRQNRTGRAGQAERKDRTGQAEQEKQRGPAKEDFLLYLFEDNMFCDGFFLKQLS